MTNPFGRPVPAATGRRPSGVTAIPAGVVGLALTGILGYLPVKVFIELGIDDLTRRFEIVLGLYLLAGLLLLVGALTTFFGAVPGGVLLLIGAVVTIGAVLSEPLLLDPTSFTQFFRAAFRFDGEDAFVRVGATLGGPVVLVLTALPATFRYLRYPAYPASSSPTQSW